MRRQNPKQIFKIMLGIFLLSLVTTGCNNSSENKSSSDSTTMKSDTAPMMDTSKMMDTTSKMDTGKTKPVSPGN